MFFLISWLLYIDLHFKNMVHWSMVLPAQVVGTASNVGQRANQVVAALERQLQQFGTNLLYLLQTHTTNSRWLYIWTLSNWKKSRNSSGEFFTTRTWSSTAAQGEGKSGGTVGHGASWGSASSQEFPNISTLSVSTPGRQRGRELSSFWVVLR